MDVDIHIYVDVQSLRTSNGESYSSVESRNTDADKYGTQGILSLFFLVRYNQLIISIGKLIVLQGSWFTTIGTIERCIERCWGVGRNGIGISTGCRRTHLPVACLVIR